MRRCHLPRCLAAFALPVLLLSARATTVIAPSFDQLVNSADYVVRATVKSVTSEWRRNPARPGQQYIASLVELEVHEVIKGTPPSPLVLDLVGGQVGDTELVIEGSPRLLVGQESFLFVRGNGRHVIPLVGLQHGHYPVRRDPASGRASVLRHDGRYLFDERDLRDPRTEPLTVAEFATRIRNTVRLQETTRERID